MAVPKGKVPRKVREREMLAVARRAFARHGFEEASMDDIAEAAGISKPMLYNYFESKGGLFYACVREEAEKLFGVVRHAAAATDLPPDERLWRGFVAFFAGSRTTATAGASSTSRPVARRRSRPVVHGRVRGCRRS